jgi:Holliday junction resolvase RusA-like endonuclease
MNTTASPAASGRRVLVDIKFPYPKFAFGSTSNAKARGTTLDQIKKVLKRPSNEKLDEGRLREGLRSLGIPDAKLDQTSRRRLQDHIIENAQPQLQIEKPVTDYLAITLVFGVLQHKRDIDGLVEPFLNALEGWLYTNDRQIAELHAFRKLAVTDPEVHLKVEILTSRDL